MTVLLLIDMQVGMSWPAAGARNNPQAEACIARLLDRWREVGAPVVHVRHISRTPGSPFWPGQPGAEFQPQLAPRDGEHVVEKNVPDAFTHTGLERWLHARGHRELVIVGVSTNNSVEATARSAGNLGFRANGLTPIAIPAQTCVQLSCSPGCSITTSAARTPPSPTNLPPPDSASTGTTS